MAQLPKSALTTINEVMENQKATTIKSLMYTFTNQNGENLFQSLCMVTMYHADPALVELLGEFTDFGEGT
jgi:hypothetical protein